MRANTGELEDQDATRLNPDLRHLGPAGVLRFQLFVALVGLLYPAASFAFAFRDCAWPESLWLVVP